MCPNEQTTTAFELKSHLSNVFHVRNSENAVIRSVAKIVCVRVRRVTSGFF